MNKQEKIFKGVLKLLSDNIALYDCQGGCPDEVAVSPDLRSQEYCDRCFSNRILNYLDSEGLVVKVAKELPEIPEFNYDKEEHRPYLRRGAINYSKMLGNWALTERLISE